MNDNQASDEVTDAIAHIEMQRQAAGQEPNANPVAAGQRALQQLQALYDEESKMPRSEERTASLHTANLDAIQAAIARLKGRLRPGGGAPSGGVGVGPRNPQQLRPMRNKGAPHPQGGQRQGGQGQGGQRPQQSGPRPQGGPRPQQGGQRPQQGPRSQQQGGPQQPQSGTPNPQGEPQHPRGPQSPSKKRRGRRPANRNPNANPNPNPNPGNTQ